MTRRRTNRISQNLISKTLSKFQTAIHNTKMKKSLVIRGTEGHTTTLLTMPGSENDQTDRKRGILQEGITATKLITNTTTNTSTSTSIDQVYKSD